MNTVGERLRRSIEARRGEMSALLQELVAVPTQNPPGEAYGECVAVIEKALLAAGLRCRVLAVAGANGPAGGLPRYCVLGGTGDQQRVLYLHGHYDVVPAASRDQLVPRIEDGRMYGRGTSDMKAGLVAMIFAARALRECGVTLDGGLGLVFVPDEETGGALGSQWLAGQGLLGRNGIGMLTPEPTSGVVWSGSRGAVTLRVTVCGRPAHVALEHEGCNAFERMLAVAGALQELKAEVARRRTVYRVEPDEARRSILMLGGECSSGRSFNTVPGQCSFTVERRFNPEEDLATEKGRLLELLDRQRRHGIELEVEVLQEGAASATDEDSELARALSASVREVAGRAPRLELCPGLLETRFYCQLGVPALAYGPGILSVSHGPAEYVQLDELLRCTRVYALTALRLLGVCEAQEQQ